MRSEPGITSHGAGAWGARNFARSYWRPSTKRPARDTPESKSVSAPVFGTPMLPGGPNSQSRLYLRHPLSPLCRTAITRDPGEDAWLIFVVAEAARVVC